MKVNKILIWGGLLTIMHYVDFLLFDRGFLLLCFLPPPQELCAV